MKILLCHNRYQQRTGEDIAFDATRELLQRGGHELVEFTRDNRDLAGRGIIRACARVPQVVYSRSSRRHAYAFASAERPDVAVVQNVFPLISPSVYYGLADAGVAIVQLVFNYRLICANGQLYSRGQICERCVGGKYMQGLANRCFRNSYPLSALYCLTLGLHHRARTWGRHVDAFVVPDRFLGDKLAAGGLPPQRMHVVPNPFDATSCQPNSSPGEYVLFVGRLILAKGIRTLLDASMQANAVPLRIIGGGEEEETVRQHPTVLQGRAEFMGPVYGDEFQDVLRGCAFVVVPSEWYDNLPMIVCQAFAAGKPVIASRINGIPEYVIHGHNGLLFEPGNTAELAAMMKRLFADKELCERLGKQARRDAEQVFSPDGWLNAMNSVFEYARERQQQEGRGHARQ